MTANANNRQVTSAQKATVLIAAVVVAVGVRVGLGAGAPAASPPAAVAFSLVLIATAIVARVRFTDLNWTGIAIGASGGVALVALSLVGLPAIHLGARASTSVLVWWVPLVTTVAAAEELVLRGVLFDALQRRSGDVVAVAVTALLFAAMHLPLYGMPALGIDLCAGVFLGCLRVMSGGVTAPLVAHVVADVATGWLG